MVGVFALFAGLRLLMIKQMGFGLAVAVLIDATIIRAVLLPSTMKLLGERNWYLPRWLEWLPSLAIESRPAPRPAGATATNGRVVVDGPVLQLDTDLRSSQVERVKAGRPG